MILRMLNLLVIGLLVFAAAYVYRIKFDSTVKAEQLAKLRTEVRRERDDIAALRAEWGKLDAPARIEELSKRFLNLKPVAPTQFDALDRLPERTAQTNAAASADPIGGMIETLVGPSAPATTGSLPDGAPIASAPAASPPPAAPNPAGATPTPPTGAPKQ